MASVIADTLEIIRQRYSDFSQGVTVEDLVVGVFFTGVKLSTGHAGVAFTPIGEIPEAVCCPTTAARMPQAGNLEGKPVSEILDYSLDRNVLKSAIGIAALNALSQAILESKRGAEYGVIEEKDGFDILEIQPGETVSLIGAFGPYIRRLKMTGNPFFIIERNTQTLRPDEMKFFRPESEMAATLGKSDVVISTGTAIVNQSMDAILGCLNRRQRTGIIGPTASMIPDAFFQRGVYLLAGLRILETAIMAKILKQGGSGYHLLQKCSQRINLVSR